MITGDLLRSVAKRNPRRIGIVFDNKSFTWREVNERVNRLANGLLSLGLKKGDRVAIIAQNSHRYVEAYLALAKAGMIFVPINWRSASTETIFILNEVEAKAILVDEQSQSLIESIYSQLTFIKYVINFERAEANGLNYLDYESLLEQSSCDEPPIEVFPDDLFLITYTSGTTGRPKGCTLTSRQWLASVQNYLIEIPVPRGEETAQLLTVPFFTGYGHFMIVAALYTRSTMVILPKFESTQVFNAIQRHKISHMAVVPTMLIDLMNATDFEDYDLSSLRLIVYGGSVIAPAVLRTALSRFKCAFCQVYGMSEAGGFVFFLTPQDHVIDGSEDCEKKLLSCGRVAQYAQMRIVDDQGADVLPGQYGELIVKCASIFLGYWNNPEQTAEILKDGWLYVGDIAYQDEEGYVYIVDRKKDMIVSGGMNIYPAEVEAVLYKHPAVAKVAVIGVPDERWGEAVKAVIELKNGAHATEHDIMEFCRPFLASQKIPKSVDFVDALPVSNSGKVSKKEIRDRYWQGQERKV